MLSKYKPVINATTLITELQQVEKTVTKALEYFNSTRHIALYYEDLIKNHTVRITHESKFLKNPVWKSSHFYLQQKKFKCS